MVVNACCVHWLQLAELVVSPIIGRLCVSVCVLTRVPASHTLVILYTWIYSPTLITNHKQVAQLSQRDSAAGWVSFGQSGRLELGDNILQTIIGLSSTTVT